MTDPTAGPDQAECKETAGNLNSAPENSGRLEYREALAQALESGDPAQVLAVRDAEMEQLRAIVSLSSPDQQYYPGTKAHAVMAELAGLRAELAGLRTRIDSALRAAQVWEDLGQEQTGTSQQQHDVAKMHRSTLRHIAKVIKNELAPEPATPPKPRNQCAWWYDTKQCPDWNQDDSDYCRHHTETRIQTFGTKFARWAKFDVDNPPEENADA